MTDVDDDGSLDHQGMAIELIGAFADHDAHALAVLDAVGRAEQLHARQVLYGYVDRMWERAKAHGLDPAVDPQFTAVVGLRDLTNALVEQAGQARADAGDND